MSAHRERRREQADEAYKLQASAGALGAAKFGAIGVSAAVVAHYSWPWFRRQTLAGKGFLVSIFTVYGLVTAADHALLNHEHEQRVAEANMRREARFDLARRGMVATESEILKWRAEKERASHSSANTQQDQQ
ncbi:hypothetical protein EVG20_g3154 [Dentipellis fragilis]|uniref:HIG1 domain-containing protein n=1 Tax=Dentipellis fragilis TaxID=205917 RepID=A0A4Y9Z6F8_9AGAM|nr:hypothetical protein EVG20_g3154 [Dentipellis fragilis]